MVEETSKYFGTLPAAIHELHDVSVFVDGFLLCNGERCCIVGRRLSTNILSESLLLSSIRLPVCFVESIYCSSRCSAVNTCLFPPLLHPDDCNFILHALSIVWSWLVFSPSNYSALSTAVCPGSVTGTADAVRLRNISNHTLKLQIIV
jgi:hypothetical protein